MLNSAQEEELEILTSIYGDETVIQRFDEINNINIIDIKIMNGVMIRIMLESTYPAESAPKIDLIGRDIPELFKESASRYFSEYFQNHIGEVVLFDCIEWVKENILMQLPTKSTENSDQGRQQQQQQHHHHHHHQKQQQLQMRDEAKQEIVVEEILHLEGYDDIYHGEPLIDRKSVFQAHVAAINSVDDAMNILSILKSDRKISRATHNMYAYRIILPSSLPSGEPIHIADNDDDGEDAAGPKLAQLLSLMNAENLIVVVSRWYGGIQLGPDRFRHIANVARTAIEESHIGKTTVDNKEKGNKSTHKKSGKRR